MWITIMDKWKEYKTYENWKSQNHTSLKAKFDECWYERQNQLEPPSFDDFCMGQWQWL